MGVGAGTQQKSPTGNCFQEDVRKMPNTNGALPVAAPHSSLCFQAQIAGREQVVDLEGDFCPVCSLQLLHDVADMDFDRALAQVQFVGDDLVRLAAPERSATSAWRLVNIPLWAGSPVCPLPAIR